MAITKFNFMTLENLTTYHGELTAWTQGQIANATANSIKTVSISKDATTGISTMHFYTVAEPVGEAQAAYSIELPHDYYTTAQIDKFVEDINKEISRVEGKADAADEKAQGAQDAVNALSAKVGAVDELGENETVIGEIGEIKETLATLTGGEGGSISDTIDAKIDALKLAETYEPIGKGAEEAGKVQDALDEYIESNDDAVAEAKKAGTDAQTYAEGVNTSLDAYKEANNKALADEVARAKEAEEANKKLVEDAQATADSKVASVTAGDASVKVAGTSTEPTVAVKLDPSADNAIKLGENGLKVEIGAAPEYTIVKDANSGDYAAIYHMEKDGVQVGASINIPKDMVVESGAVVENPDADHVGTFIKLVLQNVEEPLYINVGSLIEYVTSGSVAGDMVVVNVSDDHKVTATITDGTITLAKLATEVQTEIGKAHTHAHPEVLEGITADKVSAWDASEQNAKDYADGLDEAMGIRVKEIEDDYLKEADIANKADKATTLAGYGITDAYTKDEVNASIKAVDDKFADYTNTEDMNSAIGAVDGKFANYTNTEGMNTAITNAVDAEKALREQAEDAMDARVAELETVVHSVEPIAEADIKALFTQA